MLQSIEEVKIKMKITRMMQLMTIFCVVTFAAMLNADDKLGRFTQPTLDGKTIKSEALKGMPMVINFSSPW
jgi:hypothetical protein